jgi:hypothetical protein
MTLDPHWTVRKDGQGRVWIERPEAFSSLPISADSISIRESKECPKTETQLEEAYNKTLLNLSNRRGRPVRPITHLTASPEVVDCADLTEDGGLLDCFLPSDGTYARILTGGPSGPSAKQEALTMAKSIRIIKPCIPSTQ